MVASPAYVHAADEPTVSAWLAEAAGRKVVAVDTETAGWDPHRDRVLLVQVCAGPDLPVLVLDADRVDPRVLGGLLGDRGVLKVFHHGAFDLRFLARAGVRVRRVADTMLAQQLLDGGEATDAGVGLAGLAAFRLGVELDKDVRATFGDGWTGPSQEQLRYAAGDAHATWAVFDQQWRELVGHGLVEVARAEFAALPVLADLQLRGVAFDAERWRTLVGSLEAELPTLAQRLQRLLVTDDSPRDLFGPAPVNLDSPEQVRQALARLGVTVDTTREDVLRDHAAQPAVAALLEYRRLAKVAANWGGDWARRVRHPVTGRVHPDWRQIVAGGRISCSDPNLTQVPADARLRSCFGGAPGRLTVVADYSQQELRVLAAVSGDEALMGLFRRDGDLHRQTAAAVFAVDEGAVSPAQRAAAKQLNFGVLYGLGAQGFARATGMPPAQAREAIERYFAAFPQAAAWLADSEATARRSGRVRTPLGRIRVVGGDGAGARLARNAPIQGAGADMTKLALAEVETRLAARYGPGPDRGCRPDGLVLVAHDELVVEVDAADSDEVRDLVVDGMLAAARQVLGDVPAVVDAAVRERWGACEGTAAPGPVAPRA